MKKRQILLRLSCGLSIQRCNSYQAGPFSWRSEWALVKPSGSAVAFGAVHGGQMVRLMESETLTRAARSAFERFLCIVGNVQLGKAFVGWDWSYPSSPNAEQFNGGAGCWTVHFRPVPAVSGCNTVALGTCESGTDAEAFVAMMEPKENGVLAFEPVTA